MPLQILKGIRRRKINRKRNKDINEFFVKTNIVMDEEDIPNEESFVGGVRNEEFNRLLHFKDSASMRKSIQEEKNQEIWEDDVPLEHNVVSLAEELLQAMQQATTHERGEKIMQKLKADLATHKHVFLEEGNTTGWMRLAFNRIIDALEDAQKGLIEDPEVITHSKIQPLLENSILKEGNSSFYTTIDNN